MTKTQLTSSLPRIDQIVHISDVHIRNLKRHEEYNQVFKRVYAHVKKLKRATPNTLVFLGGDLAHAKTDMSPELVDMMQAFLKALADITEVVIILGNHDMNIANQGRLDVVSPVVDALAHPGIHFLRETGVYTLANVDFSVMAVFDDQANYVPASAIDGDNIKIALYHGIVDRAKNDSGMELMNKKVQPSVFDGYDLALLGDIHTLQWLDERKRIAYSSSLIQQGHGETVENHGFIVWRLDGPSGFSSEFVQVQNDYGYYTFDLVDGKLVGYDPGSVVRRPRIRLRVSGSTSADVKRASAELKRNHSVQEISTISTGAGTGGHSDWGYTVANIRDVATQNELLTDYARSVLGLDDEDIDRILAINTELNGELNLGDTIRNVMVKPIRFEFSNMFSFDEDNVIDFTSMGGIYGLFAKNHTGKSAIFDALIFCCFDKCTRTNRAAEIMNNKKSSFRCRFEFELNGVRYFIERRAYTSRGAIKVDVDFWYINDAGDRVLLNDTQRASTNDVIRQYLGTYEEFILTTLSAQNNNTGFIDMSQRERKDLLSNFMDITVFELLYDAASKQMQNTDVLIRNYKKQDLATQLSDAETAADDLRAQRAAVDATHAKLKSQLQDLSDAKLRLTADLRPIDAKLKGITLESLEEQRTKIASDASVLASQLAPTESQVKHYLEEVSRLTAEVAEMDAASIEQRQAERATVLSELAAVDGKIQLAEAALRHKSEKIDRLGQLEYDENCTYCMNNVFVKDAISTKDAIRVDMENLTYLRGLHGELTATASGSAGVVAEAARLSATTAELSRSKVKLLEARNAVSGLKLRHQGIAQRLANVNTMVALYHENEKAIRHNEGVQAKIALVDQERAGVQDRETRAAAELIRLAGEESVQRNIAMTTSDAIADMNRLEIAYRTYDQYMQCVKRDGIPYKLISTVLPVIENEVNTTLSQVVDFRIILNTDGKNINSYIVYDDANYWSLSITSGMEKFISSLAIRAALIKVTSLPKLSFLVIDEGLGNLDADHFNSMYLLFEYLKGQFDFIIVISHLDQARDLVENFLEITQRREYSHITHV